MPYGELVELLAKAMLYVEVEKHWAGKDQMVINCIAPFSLLEEHICNVDPNLTPIATVESALEKRDAAQSGDKSQTGAHPETRHEPMQNGMLLDSTRSYEPVINMNG